MALKNRLDQARKINDSRRHQPEEIYKMAQKQLWVDRRSAIGCGLAFTLLPMLGCAHRETGLGMSLIFLNRGTRPLTHLRFDFDGKRGPRSGYLSPGGEGKYIGFMPGDLKGGIPQSVEAEWILHSKEYSAWSNSTPSPERYSKENRKIFEKLWPTNPQYIQRVDLTPILTPDIVARVRADRGNTQLKMAIIFRDDKVNITAEPYKWR